MAEFSLEEITGTQTAPPKEFSLEEITGTQTAPVAAPVSPPTTSEEFSLEERMAMKPSHVDTSDWKKIVEELDDMDEVRNIARRMTLRIVD